jgi:hypothetical protein
MCIKKIQMSFINFIILLLIVYSISAPVISTQDEPALIIEIYDSNDWNESVGTVFFEGRNYDIIVSSENETVVLDVNISLLGISYTTSVIEPFITVLAPRFDEYESIIIKATKEGYLAAEVEITVMKGQLSAVTDRGIIEEKKGFQVTVEDQDHTPVEGALVYVIPEANPIATDLQGIAYLRAPDVEKVTTVTIQVIKSGYFPGSTNIRVENAEGFILNLTESTFLQILPILIAIIVVIFAMVYVVWRQKRTTMIPRQSTRIEPADVPNKFQQEKQGPRFKNDSAINHVKEKQTISISPPQSRVEEIRIPVERKIKETTILSKEKEARGVSEHQKKEKDDWFKGQEYMRYKLDELTGKIDQKTDGNWFEGEHDSKYKIDETLRKNFKKKKIDEEDIK